LEGSTFKYVEWTDSIGKLMGALMKIAANATSSEDRPHMADKLLRDGEICIAMVLF
jgi:hypothetical protein